MSRPLLVSILLGMSATLAGCAAKTAYNPFKVPREQFHSRVRTVALSPMAMPSGMESPDPVSAKFLRLLEARLREAGISVVGSDRARVIWDSMTTALNGIYDPVTGRRDEEKAKAVRLHTYRELKAELNIDAMLFSQVGVVPAKLDNDQARWDGASEGAARKKFWKAVLGVSHSGTIPALSLQVVLSDTDDTDLYQNAGGIQVLAKAGVGGLQPVTRAELFLNEERNAKAVRLALDPWLVGPTSR